jgi:hypothetical protein
MGDHRSRVAPALADQVLIGEPKLQDFRRLAEPAAHAHARAR